MSKPIAVLISDIHFNLNTLELAYSSLRSAFLTAKNKNLPLIIAGDMHDTKALMRGEVVNDLLDIFDEFDYVPTYVLIGNHDRLNEKSPIHAIKFLSKLSNVNIASNPIDLEFGVSLIPYCSTKEEFYHHSGEIPPGNIIIMHQGIIGAHMGDYMQDKSAVDHTRLKNHIVFSGHYHRHQTVGTVTYIGNPYTLSFNESTDPQKGYLILNDDGTFKRVLTNLRKHVVISMHTTDKLTDFEPIHYDDILWIRMHGTRLELLKVDKKAIGTHFLGHTNFKLDLIPVGDEITLKERLKHMNPMEILNKLIQDSSDNEDYKKELVAMVGGLWNLYKQ